MNKSEIKAFLIRHGLSEYDFADLIGVTQPAVNHWMTGRRAISLTVSRLCRTFDRKPELMKEFAQ